MWIFNCFHLQNVRQGISGRVAGWGLNENNENSPVLKVIDLEAVDYNTCAANAAKSFLPFILPDKFCASRLSESVCQVFWTILLSLCGMIFKLNIFVCFRATAEEDLRKR